MPPKAKFTREEIVGGALAIVREKGVSALTARSLGEKLGSSARPIFTVFENMEEVQSAVVAAAKELYAGYIAKGLAEENAFKGTGIQYICFAMREPKLFQLLFMAEQKTVPDITDVLPLIEDSYEQILSALETFYHVKREDSPHLYQHLWIYTHGIATLCATQMCTFSPAEIDRMITEVFRGLLHGLQNRDNHESET